LTNARLKFDVRSNHLVSDPVYQSLTVEIAFPLSLGRGLSGREHGARLLSMMVFLAVLTRRFCV